MFSPPPFMHACAIQKDTSGSRDYIHAYTVRALTPDMLAWCASSGRFLYHKDASLYTDVMLRKLAAVQALPSNNMKSVEFVKQFNVSFIR